jgi:2-polyprenyl-3-methyl-5-hydroxy-6-metoxy-1,4-benzoquinol methylase
MHKCYLCKKSKFYLKNKSTRDNKKVKVLQCLNCGLTTLSNFNHLKKISYAKGDMHEDAVVNIKQYNDLLNSLKTDDNRRYNQWKDKLKNKSVLDFGCGAGGFLLKAKKIAKNVCGVELDNMTKFYSKKVKILRDINNCGEKFDVITLFHVLEHLPDPISALKELKKYLNKGGIIIVEVPNDNDALVSYYKLAAFKNFTYWSFHLYSYTIQTLKTIIITSGLNPKINYFQRYSLANHIGWLKDGLPGGHIKYKEISSGSLNQAYSQQLQKLSISDTLIAICKK